MNAPSFDWRPLTSFSWDAIAEAFRRSYEGYVIPIRLTAQQMETRFAAEDLSMAQSGIGYVDGELAGIGLVARRGRAARLAAFGVAPSFRGKGLASAMLERIVNANAAHGDGTMELEVFEHNTPAVKLYERFGFTRKDRLMGFEKPSQSSAAGRDLQFSTPEAFAERIAAEGELDLPWQLQPETLARLSAPWQVAHDGDGACALVDLSKEAVVDLRLLHVAPHLRGKGKARALLTAIEASAGERPIRVPQLIPSRHQALAKALGFAPLQHCQWRMVR